MGAAASKKRQALPADEPLNVRGQSARRSGGRWPPAPGRFRSIRSTRWRCRVILRVLLHQAASLPREKASRSTASAPPAATRVFSAQARRQEPISRISSFSKPEAESSRSAFRRVGADQLRKAFFLVGRAEMQGLLLIQMHLHPLIVPADRAASHPAKPAPDGSVISLIGLPFHIRFFKIATVLGAVQFSALAEQGRAALVAGGRSPAHPRS